MQAEKAFSVRVKFESKNFLSLSYTFFHCNARSIQINHFKPIMSSISRGPGPYYYDDIDQDNIDNSDSPSFPNHHYYSVQTTINPMMEERSEVMNKVDKDKIFGNLPPMGHMDLGIGSMKQSIEPCP